MKCNEYYIISYHIMLYYILYIIYYILYIIYYILYIIYYILYITLYYIILYYIIYILCYIILYYIILYYIILLYTMCKSLWNWLNMQWWVPPINGLIHPSSFTSHRLRDRWNRFWRRARRGHCSELWDCCTLPKNPTIVTAANHVCI